MPMRAHSCVSVELEPYRAGLELASQLVELAPEVVFLFPSIHYQGSTELVAGLYDGLGNDELLVLGNTGNGFYCTDHCGEIGVAALGLNDAGRIRYHVSHATGVLAEPYATARRCVEGLGEARARCRLFFFAVDFRTDTSEVLRAMQQELPAPAVGGAAGDDYRMTQSFQYLNRQVLEDSLVLIGLEGDFSFDISVAHELRPIGKIGIVTGSEGVTLTSIDNKPTLQFVTEQIGRPCLEMDMGVICFRVETSVETSEARLRSLMPFPDHESGAVKLYGGIEPGSLVKCCVAQPDDMLREVDQLVTSLARLTFQPRAALVVSCAGRKQLLAGRVSGELEPLMRLKWVGEAAVAGYPSYGEFGPVRNETGYSRHLFHNMTYLLLLLGDAPGHD